MPTNAGRAAETSSEALRPRNTRALKSPKASELIARWLRRRMHEDRMEPGDPLPSESELCTRFDVSRPTLREALRLLEAQQLITITRGATGGARCARPDEEMVATHMGVYLEAHRVTQLDLTEARSNLEPCIIGFIADSISSSDIAVLRQAVEAQAAARKDHALFAREHERFYSLLGTLCPNQTLALQFLMLRDLMRAQTELVGDDVLAHGGQAQRAIAAHIKAKRRLLELFESHDRQGAEELWKKHLQAQIKQLTTAGRGDILVRAP